jgi:hypothetical protein
MTVLRVMGEMEEIAGCSLYVRGASLCKDVCRVLDSECGISTISHTRG